MHRTQWSVLIATVLAVTLFGSVASATKKSHCEVLTILASKQATAKTSPPLNRFKRAFAQEPFNRFNSFELVRSEKLALTLGQPAKLQLTSGLGGSLELTGRVEKKLNLTLTLARNGTRPARIATRATPGTPFFTAGLKNEKGTWIVGIICNGH